MSTVSENANNKKNGTRDLVRLTAAGFLFSFVGFGSVCGLIACNTVEGVGEDIEGLGDAIDDSSEDAQDEMDDDD